MIQIYLDDPGRLTWNLWVYASQDRHRKRYWKNSFLRRAVPMTEIDSQLEKLLLAAKRMADAWKATDLEFATDLAQ